MQIKDAQYIVTAVRPDQYPAHQLPEIAFVGRSNVGKSSLINGLVKRKNLARVAAKPGKTREINFYRVNTDLFLVDLPGYGYAKVSKTEKEAWIGMIESYLNTRAQLKAVLMLVDIRHTPTADDQLMHDWLKSRDIPYLIIATKQDKIPRSRTNSRILEIQTVFGLGNDTAVVPFSAESGQGRDEIWRWVEAGIR